MGRRRNHPDKSEAGRERRESATVRELVVAQEELAKEEKRLTLEVGRRELRAQEAARVLP